MPLISLAQGYKWPLTHPSCVCVVLFFLPSSLPSSSSSLCLVLLLRHLESTLGLCRRRRRCPRRSCVVVGHCRDVFHCLPRVVVVVVVAWSLSCVRFSYALDVVERLCLDVVLVLRLDLFLPPLRLFFRRRFASDPVSAPATRPSSFLTSSLSSLLSSFVLSATATIKVSDSLSPKLVIVILIVVVVVATVGILDVDI